MLSTNTALKAQGQERERNTSVQPTLMPRDTAAWGLFGSPQPGSSPESIFLAFFFLTPSHSASQPPPFPHPAARCHRQPRFWVIWGERALAPLSSMGWGLCCAAEEQREGKGQYLLTFLPIPGIQDPRRGGSLPCCFGSPHQLQCAVLVYMSTQI